MPAEVVRVGAQRRLVLRAGKVACVPDALVHYRKREGSISKQHSAANLVDYWLAYLRRYEELRGISAECRRRVDAMMRFARGHTHEESCGEYSLGDRVCCVVGRHALPVVWVPMGALDRLRHVFSRRRGLYG